MYFPVYNVPFLKYLMFPDFVKNHNSLNFANKNIQYIQVYEEK